MFVALFFKQTRAWIARVREGWYKQSWMRKIKKKNSSTDTSWESIHSKIFTEEYKVKVSKRTKSWKQKKRRKSQEVHSQSKFHKYININAHFKILSFCFCHIENPSMFAQDRSL